MMEYYREKVTYLEVISLYSQVGIHQRSHKSQPWKGDTPPSEFLQIYKTTNWAKEGPASSFYKPPNQLEESNLLRTLKS